MHITYRWVQIQYYLDYLIEHCILAVAFFLPLSINITSSFLGLGAVCWLGKMLILRRAKFRQTQFDNLIILFVVLSALSILVAPDRNFSFYNYYHLMGRYILLYYFMINNVHSLEQIKRLIWAVLASAAVVAGYGFYQYLHGMDISTFEWVDGEQFPDLKMRVFSTLYNPNLLAGFLVIVMALAAGIGLKTQSLMRKILLFGLTAALGICLVLTYSRGAWLSILVIIIVYGLFYNLKILWVLLIIPLGMLFAHDAVIERLVSIFNPMDTSCTMRLALWESTLAMIWDKPLLGIGWGSYWLVYPSYNFFLQDASTKIYHAHNMYLHIAAEIGIPGLMTFLAIMYGHVRMAFRILGGTDDRWVSGLMLGLLSAILGLAVGGFTDYIMYNIQMSMLFWLLNALVILVWQESSCFQKKWML